MSDWKKTNIATSAFEIVSQETYDLWHANPALNERAFLWERVDASTPKNVPAVEAEKRSSGRPKKNNEPTEAENQ